MFRRISEPDLSLFCEELFSSFTGKLIPPIGLLLLAAAAEVLCDNSDIQQELRVWKSDVNSLGDDQCCLDLSFFKP